MLFLCRFIGEGFHHRKLPGFTQTEEAVIQRVGLVGMDFFFQVSGEPQEFFLTAGFDGHPG